MSEKADHRCENCMHCDVIDYYCYEKFKPIESMLDGADCEEWEMWEE